MDRHVVIGTATKASDQNYSTNAVNATAYTIVDTDKYDCIAITTAGSASIITLPTASDNDDRIITIIKVDSGSGDVDITPEGSENINGYNAAFKLNGQWQRATVKSDGSNWIILDCLGTLLGFNSQVLVAITSPNRSTWYNPTAHSLAFTEGKWKARYKVRVDSSRAGSLGIVVMATLSTANNSESDLNWTTGGSWSYDHATAETGGSWTCQYEDILDIASSGTRYLNIYAYATGGTALSFLRTRGDQAGTIISARRIA